MTSTGLIAAAALMALTPIITSAQPAGAPSAKPAVNIARQDVSSDSNPSTSANMPRAPYPASAVIEGMTFQAETERLLAPGSDIWALTWGADGHQYTVFGDGGGFGGTNQDARVSLGVARIEGGKRDFVGVNIAGGKNAPQKLPFTGKSLGILAVGDVLYLWRHGKGSDNSAFEFAELHRSTNNAVSWERLPVEFSKRNGDFTGQDHGFFSLAFCQFGPGYSAARDAFVYLYASEIADATHWNIQKPGRIALLRVPKERLAEKAAYQFFAGMDPAGTPTWTADLTRRKSVWEDPVNGTHRIAVSYNAGLKRYFLSAMTVDRVGWAAIFDAPEPWGPWTTVLFEKNPERWGKKVITFTFSNKWASADGKDFVLVHTKDDAWASIEGAFRLK